MPWQTIWTPATIRNRGTPATAGMSAASVVDPWHFGTDPQIWVLSFSAYYFLKEQLYHFSMIKSHEEVTKVESRFFLLFLLSDRRIRSRIRTSDSWIRIQETKKRTDSQHCLLRRGTRLPARVTAKAWGACKSRDANNKQGRQQAGSPEWRRQKMNAKSSKKLWQKQGWRLQQGRLQRDASNTGPIQGTSLWSRDVFLQ